VAERTRKKDEREGFRDGSFPDVRPRVFGGDEGSLD
jgi:hypothetical protein